MEKQLSEAAHLNSSERIPFLDFYLYDRNSINEIYHFTLTMGTMLYIYMQERYRHSALYTDVCARRSSATYDTCLRRLGHVELRRPLGLYLVPAFTTPTELYRYEPRS